LRATDRPRRCRARVQISPHDDRSAVAGPHIKRKRVRSGLAKGINESGFIKVAGTVESRHADDAVHAGVERSTSAHAAAADTTTASDTTTAASTPAASNTAKASAQAAAASAHTAAADSTQGGREVREAIDGIEVSVNTQPNVTSVSRDSRRDGHRLAAKSWGRNRHKRNGSLTVRSRAWTVCPQCAQSENDPKSLCRSHIEPRLARRESGGLTDLLIVRSRSTPLIMT
jgi:hypothetical protein